MNSLIAGIFVGYVLYEGWPWDASTGGAMPWLVALGVIFLLGIFGGAKADRY